MPNAAIKLIKKYTQPNHLGLFKRKTRIMEKIIPKRSSRMNREGSIITFIKLQITNKRKNANGTVVL
jgi:hypothetical protein